MPIPAKMRNVAGNEICNGDAQTVDVPLGMRVMLYQTQVSLTERIKNKPRGNIHGVRELSAIILVISTAQW
jgi:hypothetical protein